MQIAELEKLALDAPWPNETDASGSPTSARQARMAKTRIRHRMTYNQSRRRNYAIEERIEKGLIIVQEHIRSLEDKQQQQQSMQRLQQIVIGTAVLNATASSIQRSYSPENLPQPCSSRILRSAMSRHGLERESCHDRKPTADRIE